ncbi:hypothetical protein EDB85DRAFT_1899862 [Lactarius pseudohatsudake]|nr:hypothetical protein EDB85DRAFT_1899862 [Lactarius pseudohatsudake]
MATSAPAGKAEKAQASAAVALADTQDERWTRVEARKKKAVSPQDGLSKLQTTVAAAEATTSKAVTASATGNSSPVTERTTEDELLVQKTSDRRLRNGIKNKTHSSRSCLSRPHRTHHLVWYPCVRCRASSPRRGSHGSVRGLVRHNGVALRQ